MKDLTKAEANEAMNKARDKFCQKTTQIASFWWKYWALRKINTAVKKGKCEIIVMAPLSCSAEICAILSARRFRYYTYTSNIFTIKVRINWA